MIRSTKSQLFGARIARLLRVKAALFETGLIVPLTAKDALAHAELAVKAGAKVFEVYFRASNEGSYESDIRAAMDAITALKKKYSDIVVGAGSVDTAELVALAIEAGADFLVNQGWTDAALQVAAAHCVLPIFGCKDSDRISELREQLDRLFQFEFSDSELEAAGISRVEANSHLVKFFNADGEIKQFDGIAATYSGKYLRFVIAGGVKIGTSAADSSSGPVWAQEKSTLHTDQTVAGWSTRPLVCGLTLSDMMKGEVEANVREVLRLIKFGRNNPKK